MTDSSPDPTEPPRRYLWPWFFWGFVLLGFLLAVIWLTPEIKRLERERDYNAPIPTSSTPAH